MKKIRFVCVGRIREKYINDGIDEYLKRLKKYCGVEIVETGAFPDGADPVRRESAEITKKLSGFNILLEVGGTLLSSQELAAELDGVYTRGFDTVTFIIGGSAGVDETIKKAADLRVSFGRVTYPHTLMRLIALEQAYRAFSILDNSPYHK